MTHTVSLSRVVSRTSGMTGLGEPIEAVQSRALRCHLKKSVFILPIVWRP